ncbi:hypothetical protein OWP16_04630 [Bacillus paranthracis]|uniref:hypothetical protein n=1 Tax=Bacillus paranthracis TaxID=2026186 RepID=UPI00254A9889|nr:hypothetical protein [Bacillus paranthracis]MDK7419272.1 hypothetical protein [Bacillus paranthracis]MDK7430863.1 hypothetical protein [Bacillus paranthracis]MDK7516572.1 hypothetical protein [Bacillus paranthracis]MDK7572406.1 hypothetical protein [Bacillus paranthracis]
MNKLENLVNQLEKAINIESKPENRILADKDVYYKDSVVFSKDTDIPKDAEYVKVYCGVSEEFLNEVKKHFPHENPFYIGFGFEKYMGVRKFQKTDPFEEMEKAEDELMEKYPDLNDMPEF